MHYTLCSNIGIIMKHNITAVYDVYLCLYLLSVQDAKIESLLLGLERRLLQLASDVSVLEREDDGDLYGVISLQLLEIELLELQQLINRLNTTTVAYRHLTDNTVELVKSQHQWPNAVIVGMQLAQFSNLHEFQTKMKKTDIKYDIVHPITS